MQDPLPLPPGPFSFTIILLNSLSLSNQVYFLYDTPIVPGCLFCIDIGERYFGSLHWHFMVNRWGNNGNSDRLDFFGSKITADGDCSHEIKKWLLFGRKAMSNLDSILKSRDIALPTKAHLVKAIVFPEVMYGCESWTIKKA